MQDSRFCAADSSPNVLEFMETLDRQGIYDDDFAVTGCKIFRKDYAYGRKGEWSSHFREICGPSIAPSYIRHNAHLPLPKYACIVPKEVTPNCVVLVRISKLVMHIEGHSCKALPSTLNLQFYWLVLRLSRVSPQLRNYKQPLWCPVTPWPCVYVGWFDVYDME